MSSKFFTFAKPYLSAIDHGHLFRRPFSWLYTLIAGLNLLFPAYIMYEAVDKRIFSAAGKYILVFVLTWIIILLASWISFQLWWDRKSKVTASSSEDDQFIATPVFAHFIQTTGEWLGTWIAIVGTGVALLASVILGSDAYYFTRKIGIPFVETGIVFVVLMPIYGFLIITGTRFLAEQFKALASIANNTKK